MYIHVHDLIYLYVHGTYMFMHVKICMDSTDTSVQLLNHTSFPIRPNQPCDAGESQLRAGASPSEQPSEQLVKRLFLLNNWLNHVHTLYIHVHTVYRHVHMLYMGTSHFMHVPLWYMPLHTLLYHTCTTFRQCWYTRVSHSVQAGFQHVYTP